MKDLKQVAKKAMLMGIGLEIMTRNKARKAAENLLKKGKASEKEIKEFTDKIMKEARKKEIFIRTLVENEAKAAKAKAEKKAKKLKTEYENQLKELKKRVKKAEKKANQTYVPKRNKKL